jgi:hypothetical protein
MRSNKPYTNATFTKRVDHDAGRHRPARAISEPAVCASCGAVYAKRRWTAPQPDSEKRKHERLQSPQTVLCSACLQQRKGEPRGFLHLDGSFFLGQHEGIEKLLRREAARAAEDNPLARILEWKRDGKHELTVTTTTEHLAQRLGHALEKAFGGDTHYDFSHENKLARVSWRRE